MEMSPMFLIRLLIQALFAHAQQSFYLTQFPAIATLAPCASSGFINAVNSLTSECNTLQAPTAFASCACLKDQNSVSLSEQIVSLVTYNCGQTATQDVTSAVGVLSAYCAAVPNPTTAMIQPPTLTSLPSLTNLPTAVTLAPCAASGLSVAIGWMTTDVPVLANLSQQASCACVKNNNSAAISTNIVSQVESRCSSTATEDVRSALAAFSTYCALGTTSLGNTTFAPMITSIGPMSDIDYITSLAPCASNAFKGAVNDITDTCNVASGVTAFASCVCANSSNSNSISVSLVNNVEYSCSHTATEDITSALGVFSSYCALAGGARGPATAAITGPGAVTTATSTPSDGSSNSVGLGIFGQAGIGGGIGFLILIIIILFCCNKLRKTPAVAFTTGEYNLGPMQRPYEGGYPTAPSAATQQYSRDWPRDNYPSQRQTDYLYRSQQNETWSRPAASGLSDFQKEDRRQDGLRAAERQKNEAAAVASYAKIPP